MNTILYYISRLLSDTAWAIRASLCCHKWVFTGTFCDDVNNGPRQFVDTYRCSKCQTYTRCPRSPSTFLKEAPPVYGFRSYT